MKKIYFCIFFLLHCIFLLGFSPLQIIFNLQNKTDSEIIVSFELNPEFFSEYEGQQDVRFLLEDGKKTISVTTFAISDTNIPVPQGEDIWLMNIVKDEKLLTLPPLKIFNTVISSLCVADLNNTILLTEKDVTNDSFVRYASRSTSFKGERNITFTLNIQGEK